jgi:hypothetical protein
MSLPIEYSHCLWSTLQREGFFDNAVVKVQRQGHGSSLT